MPSKPRVSGWYVDLEGKKSGPHNVEEIRELLASKRILADQRVFSEAELRPQGAHSNRPLHVGELLDQYTDPALSLLDALQAARGQKKAKAPSNIQNAVAEDRNSPNAGASSSKDVHLARGVKNPDRKPDLPPQLAIFASTAMVAAAVVWGTLQLLKHGPAMPPSQSQVAKGAEGIQTAPIGSEPEAHTPPHSATAPAATAPAIQPIMPVAGGFASRLKAKPFGRPLASLPSQGRPTPPEPAATERDERDTVDAKEREQHDRDVRDAQDTGGGGGQPIDGEPGQQATPQPPANGNESNANGEAAPPPSDPNPNQN